MNEKELLHTMKKKKDVTSYLPEYISRFAGLYHDYASIQLAFSYYTVYEILAEDENTEFAKGYITDLNHALLLDGDDAIAAISALRDRVMKTMDNITLYTDILSVYEHILNRIEYRFKENTVPDLEYSATRIQQFLFADKDAVVTNDKIKKIVSELPLRMTKQRFYDILEESLKIYLGSDESSVDGFVYMIRTIGMLKDDLQPVEGLPDLPSFVSHCKTMDYSHMEEADFINLSEQLNLYGKELSRIVNIYMQLQECINHYYTILLCRPYVKEKTNTSDIAGNMTMHICHHFEEDSDTVLSGCNDYLEQLEGRQEDVMERVMGFEALLTDVTKTYPQEKGIQDLNICLKLVSTSIFIDLNEEETSEIADETYIAQTTKNLIAEFASFFKENSQIVNRAVMSVVLGAVPVFFSNTQEITDYVKYSLEHCSDPSELCASLDIINDIMK